VMLAGSLLGAMPSAMATPTLSIDAPSHVLEGSSFDVKVRIDEVDDLFALQLDFAFGPALLKALSVSEGAFLSGGGTTFAELGTIDNPSGTISGLANTLIGDLPGVTGAGVLFIIRLQARDAGVAALSVVNEILLDSGLADLLVVSGDASVTISPREVTVPEPASSILFLVMAGTLISVWQLTARQRR